MRGAARLRGSIGSFRRHNWAGLLGLVALSLASLPTDRLAVKVINQIPIQEE